MQRQGENDSRQPLRAFDGQKEREELDQQRQGRVEHARPVHGDAVRWIEPPGQRPIDWGTFWYIGRYTDTKWNSGAIGDQGPFQWLSDHISTLNVLAYALSSEHLTEDEASKLLGRQARKPWNLI